MHMKSPGKIFTLFSVVEVESEIGQETNVGHFTRDTSSPCQHHKLLDKITHCEDSGATNADPTRQNDAHTSPGANHQIEQGLAS